ncbi:hypothetical protein SprV_0401574800 [Sparganum proliferum]
MRGTQTPSATVRFEPSGGGDARQSVLASRFGYAVGGSLLVEVNNLPKSLLNHVGFIIDRTTSGSIDTRDKSKHGHCMLTTDFPKSESDNVVVFKFERRHGRLLAGSDQLFVRPANYDTVFGLKFVDAADRKSLTSLVEPLARFLQTQTNIKMPDAIQRVENLLEFVRGNPALLAEIQDVVDDGGERTAYNLLNAFLNYYNAKQRSRRSAPVVHEGETVDEKANIRQLLPRLPSEDKQLEDIVKKRVGDEKANAGKQEDLEANQNEAAGLKDGKQSRVKAAAKSDDSPKEAAKKPEAAVGDAGNNAVPPNVVADASAKKKPEDETAQKPESGAADSKIPEPETGDKVAAPGPADQAAGKANPPKEEDLPNGENRDVKAMGRPEEHEVPQAEKPEPSVPDEVVDVVKEAVEVFNRDQLIFPYLIKDDLVSVSFSVSFTSESAAGSYDLYFHNCGEAPADVSITMTEQNPDSFLSVGEQPLCILYTVFSIIYFLLSIIWFIHLRLSTAPVYRIHYLMFAMIFAKASSLAFHAINFYVIGKHGVPEEGWAVMYYISHMTRGFLLFVTILMIGAGWTFIKHVFSRREKHLFAIIIPLQVLANVATIVMEESEQGASRYVTWKEIFTVVDLVCCVIILFPVIWSIRHLQAAAQSDGKAAQNLRKLRLFRHFYIMVICYIYFTRIIVYLLKLTIPAHMNWLVELFQELVTLVFLVSIGYKFRPFNDNPYLQVPSDDDEDTLLERFDLEEVWSQSGLTDGVTRLHRPQAVSAALTSRKQRASRTADLEAATADAGDSDLAPLIRP